MSTNKSLKSRRRFENKNEKELIYEELFPPYESLYKYHIYFINALTSEEELKNVCDIINGKTDFIFDTESDIHSKTPALIQVLIVQEDPKPLLVLLIETTHLPDISSLRFREIQKLFQYLFRTGTNLYSWGPLTDELTRFQIYQLFSLPDPARIFNVQRIFTKWFNEYINKTSNDNNNNSNTTTNDDSVIINAPEIDPQLFLPPIMMNDLKVRNNELWSLQDAIAYIFYKYLSKRETLRSWSIGLDKRLPSRNKNYSLNYRKRLIQYASYDCLSLLEIILFMYENYLFDHPVNNLHIQSLGEYFSYVTTDFTSFSSSSAKNHHMYEKLFDDDSDDSMTVHDLDERHQFSSEDQINEQYLDITSHSPEHQTIEPFSNFDQHYQELESNYDINENQQVLQQHYDIYPQQQEIDFYVPHDQYLTTDQHHSQQTNYHHEIEINYHVQDNNLNVISNSSGKTKTKSTSKRSKAARERRNIKTNRRHRRNRYKFEIIRPLNTTIANVKKILHSYAVPYLNVNPVQSTLYIDLKSKDFQDYFEQLLPMDIFL
ncbi:unnamed protein product [Rotaria sordida]|uniref:Uncharacterized protein n=2 Tax=Rotaria sordida TaxID=392033 RepID=A0A815JII5_9BILA|nr:unnamed protein product [Rotaria sordida]CAF1381573.1 unnamed protein product [Rotaria sordida]CAF1615093.1 unnamed protein product [Rotaria sordida]CAF4045007.1 unnamed protein product [Rotaria sordida]